LRLFRSLVQFVGRRPLSQQHQQQQRSNWHRRSTSVCGREITVVGAYSAAAAGYASFHDCRLSALNRERIIM